MSNLDKIDNLELRDDQLAAIDLVLKCKMAVEIAGKEKDLTKRIIARDALKKSIQELKNSFEVEFLMISSARLSLVRLMKIHEVIGDKEISNLCGSIGADIEQLLRELKNEK